jgi:general secretion pathway protein G
MMNTKRNGFTLIELLIVMAIIGMLAAIVAPRFIDQGDKAKVQATVAQMKNLEQALDTHRLDVGKYPRTLEGLVKNESNSQTWNGPYMRKGIPNDAWGNPYHYQTPGRHNKDFDLYSYGGDGREGGDGYDADLTNW